MTKGKPLDITTNTLKCVQNNPPGATPRGGFSFARPWETIM